MEWRHELKKNELALLVLGVTVLWSARAVACEPILPLVTLFGSPYLALESGVWLLVAVGVKCALYAFLEKGAPRRSSAAKMFVANIVSTLGGVVVSAFVFGIPVIFFVSLPVVGILSVMPARRLLIHLRRSEPSRVSVGLVSAAFPIAMLVTTWLFVGAERALGSLSDMGRVIGVPLTSEPNLVRYWILKYLMVTLALLVSIVLSASWEEAVVARLGRADAPPFSEAVFRANFLTVGLVMFAAAIRMLPARLAAPHFLVELLRGLSHSG